MPLVVHRTALPYDAGPLVVIGAACGAHAAVTSTGVRQ